MLQLLLLLLSWFASVASQSSENETTTTTKATLAGATTALTTLSSASVVEVASIAVTPTCLHSMIFHDGVWIRSEGGHGGATLTKYSLDGKAEDNDDVYTGSFKLDNLYEPEGVAYRRDTDSIYLLTERNRVFVFIDADDGLELHDDDDRGSITPLQPLVGLTYAGNKTFVGSDGSNRLYFLDADDFEVLRTVAVVSDDDVMLLELEWVNGLVWATVANNQTLLVIDPRSGAVLHVVPVAHLAPATCEPSVCVCNAYPVVHGIAFDQVWGRMWISGNGWPRVVEIQVIGSNGAPLWSTLKADDTDDADENDTMLTIYFVGGALICLCAIGLTTYVSHTAQKRAFAPGKA